MNCLYCNKEIFPISNLKGKSDYKYLCNFCHFYSTLDKNYNILSFQGNITYNAKQFGIHYKNNLFSISLYYDYSYDLITSTIISFKDLNKEKIDKSIEKAFKLITIL